MSVIPEVEVWEALQRANEFRKELGLILQSTIKLVGEVGDRVELLEKRVTLLEDWPKQEPADE